jgi:hypothetical protein
MKKIGNEFTSRSADAQAINDELLKLQIELLPNFGPNWHRHSMIGMKVEALARSLYYAEIYKRILDVPGVICEFGVHWGATLVELINLRSIFEPFNHSRTVFGFDTFEGFPALNAKDGKLLKKGDFSTSENYQETLSKILSLHEATAPYPHIKKFSLVKGDAGITFNKWLDKNPHAIISMAIFDMDLYKPTNEILKKIVPRLTKGSILVFDELNCEIFPGETVALRETIGLEKLRLRRVPYQPFCSWAIWGE